MVKEYWEYKHHSWQPYLCVLVTFLSVPEQDVKVREQKESLERFLKRIVNDKELAHCYLSLQFLGEALFPSIVSFCQRLNFCLNECLIQCFQL